jgi:hypothetical protein
MGRTCSTHRGDEKLYNILVGRSDGKKSFEISRRKRIKSKCILDVLGVRLWTGLIHLSTGRNNGIV